LAIGAAVGPCTTYVHCTYYKILYTALHITVPNTMWVQKAVRTVSDCIGPPDWTGPAMASGQMVWSEAI